MKRNNIFVLSRKAFEEFAATLSPEQLPLAAFISIHEPEHSIDGGKSLAWPEILPTSSNVLNLWFDDVEEDLPLVDGTHCVLFDNEMAARTFKFVQNNLTAKLWFIHCTMGKCRSGAVGDVLSEYLGIDYYDFKRTNPRVQPNILVKKLLRQQFFNNGQI